MFLPDINLWLALTFDVHFHHTAAKGWFESQARESFAFCRFTQQGFLRLASNPKALKESAVPLQEGWRLYDTILTDSRISFLAEPDGLASYWPSYTRVSTLSPKICSDAYLAAFARAGGLHLVTFDQGFSQFKDLT